MRTSQIGGAIVGPLVKDKMHFFASFERENEPNTILAARRCCPDAAARTVVYVRYETDSNSFRAQRAQYHDVRPAATNLLNAYQPRVMQLAFKVSF